MWCSDPRVLAVEAHQCEFGFTAPLHGTHGEVGAAKKPTGFMTNRVQIAEALHRTCGGRHEHSALTGGRGAAASKVPVGVARCDMQGHCGTEGA